MSATFLVAVSDALHRAGQPHLATEAPREPARLTERAGEHTALTERTGQAFPWRGRNAAFDALNETGDSRCTACINMVLSADVVPVGRLGIEDRVGIYEGRIDKQPPAYIRRRHCLEVGHEAGCAKRVVVKLKETTSSLGTNAPRSTRPAVAVGMASSAGTSAGFRLAPIRPP